MNGGGISPITHRNGSTKDENSDILSSNSAAPINIPNMSPIKRTINRSNLVSDSLKNQPEPVKKPRIETNFKVPEPKKVELSESFIASTQIPKTQEPPKIINTKIIPEKFSENDPQILLTQEEVEIISQLAAIKIKETEIKKLLVYIIKKIDNPLPLFNFLISRGFDVNSADEKGWTVLHQTVVLNDVESAEFLLKNGADPNFAPKTQINEYLTPIEFACTLSLLDLIRLMIMYGGNMGTLEEEKLRCLSLIICPTTRKYFMEHLIDIRAYPFDPISKTPEYFLSPEFSKGIWRYKQLSDVPEFSFIKEDINPSLNTSQLSQSTESSRQRPQTYIFNLEICENSYIVIPLECHLEKFNLDELKKKYNLPDDAIMKLTWKSIANACYTLKEDYLNGIKDKFNFKDDHILHLVDAATALSSGLKKDLIRK